MAGALEDDGPRDGLPCAEVGEREGAWTFDGTPELDDTGTGLDRRRREVAPHEVQGGRQLDGAESREGRGPDFGLGRERPRTAHGRRAAPPRPRIDRHALVLA